MKKVIYSLIITAILCSLILVPGEQRVRAEPEAPTEVPTTLVGSGVWNYALAAPKLFWYTGVPACPPGAPEPDNPEVTYPETIRRIATYGSSVRKMYEEYRNCGQGQIPSSIAADENYVYWLSYTGLYKLSTNANVGDTPQLVNALLKYPGELAIGADYIYAIFTEVVSPHNKKVGYVRKDNNQLVTLTTPGDAHDLQIDGEYIYYRVGGNLIRLNPGVDIGVTLDNGVTGYYPEGRVFLYCTIDPYACYYSRKVYIAEGRDIYVYNNNTNTLNPAPIYTSPDSKASIYELVSVPKISSTDLFFFEKREGVCNLLCDYTTIIFRHRSGSASALYTFGPVTADQLDNLTTDRTYLFWEEQGMLKRLPNDSAALPSVNMWITGMEVTQGIQDTSHSVVLIKNRRTFVRLYVKSLNTAVSGVMARLTSRVVGSGSLASVNSTGQSITVRVNPDRNDINQSFLFELPWSWTQQDSLEINANLNPYKVPLEPSYADNSWSTTINFQPSPSLSVEFFRLNYNLNNTTYKPRIVEDVLLAWSWMLRAYPLGGAIGENFKPRLWDVDGGAELGSYVNQSSPVCVLNYPDPKWRNLCASYVGNGWLFYYRISTIFGQLNVGLNPAAFYYGMITDAAGFFPRGQAMYSLTSVGPTGMPGAGSWDTDGSYGDWYAAHEIGHSLGRSHPNPGSDDPATDKVTENCGHSRSDPAYPYGNIYTASTPIGPASGSLEGFDVGDPSYGIAPAVYPSNTWNDVMSYCDRQWISDYTYENIYNYMIVHPSLPELVPGAEYPTPSGDYLAVAGMINPANKSAGFSFIRRPNEVTNVPPFVAGDYSIRLLNALDVQLASYSFIPVDYGDTGLLSFGQVVNFVAGTRKVQLVKNANGAVLATQPVSANPPVVSNVALIGAPNPVSGVVTLGWSASDTDGDALVFDIVYSRNNGVTFQPVKINVSGNNTQIDTAGLGGSGTAILRVIASDGVNSAFGDSVPFVMANKPPQTYIMVPADNTQVHYGQLVNFSGLALDVQDGLVGAAGLVWKNAGNITLGTGPTLSIVDLPIGTNVITLQATNSVGQTAHATVTVIVDDDLDLPGPTLTVGPTQVGWQVSVGETQVQSSQISISNAGSGSLSWTASEASPWLSLSASGGTVPAGGDPSTLTLYADPGGLVSGLTYGAEVTIVKPADGESPEQSIIIPVSLSIGFVRDGAQTNNIFLPLVKR